MVIIELVYVSLLPPSKILGQLLRAREINKMELLPSRSLWCREKRRNVWKIETKCWKALEGYKWINDAEIKMASLLIKFLHGEQMSCISYTEMQKHNDTSCPSSLSPPPFLIFSFDFYDMLCLFFLITRLTLHQNKEFNKGWVGKA